MKLYPSPFTIKTAETVAHQDIPLSKIELGVLRNRVTASELNFRGSIREREFVVPYERFAYPDPFVYDEQGRPVNIDNNLVRVGNHYVYTPQGAVEFTPHRTVLQAVVHKNMSYRAEHKYNYRIACVGTTLDYAETLHSIFGDAPRRQLCPANISVNGQDLAMDSLLNASATDLDWAMFESSDGLTTGGQVIPFDELLNQRTNIWLSVDSFNDGVTNFMVEKPEHGVTLRAPHLYRNDPRTFDEGVRFFRTDAVHSAFAGGAYELVNLFSQTDTVPVLVYQKPGHGFVIIADKKITDRPDRNVQMIYEILTHGVLKSWYLSNPQHIWITDKNVDYLALKENRYNRRHPPVTEKVLVASSRYIIDVYRIIDFVFRGRPLQWEAIGNEIYFNKTGSGLEPDPVKPFDPDNPDKIVSVYTARHTVVYYERSVQKREEGLSAQVVTRSTGSYLILSPGKSTSRRIHFAMPYEFRIVPPYKEYHLVAENNIPSLYAGALDELTEEAVVLYKVSVKEENITRHLDLRAMGGGLPAGMLDDYGLLDIGHVNGRPYRVGSSVVIRLPATLKPYEKEIRAAVDKHQSGADYAVYVFE